MTELRTTLMRLKDRGINVVDANAGLPDVWEALLARHEGMDALDPPAMIGSSAFLVKPCTLAPGCIIAGLVTTEVTLGPHCIIGRQGAIEGTKPSTVAANCTIDGILSESTLGEGTVISRHSAVRASTLGRGNHIGGEHGSGPEGGLVEGCTLGDENVISGRLHRCTVGSTNHLDGDLEECTIGDAVRFRRSDAWRSHLGDQTRVLDQGHLSEAVCLPFRQTCGDETIVHPVTILRARVTKSVVWGGSDLNDGVVIRSNSVIGPFVHMGAGSETKGALLRGVSPTSSVEVPHRSYLGNCLAVSLIGASGEDTVSLYEDPGESARQQRLAFRRPVTTHAREQLVPDGFHEPESLTFDVEGQEEVLTAEGINCGALFTTSNFDPRLGGTKWPTMISGGMKLGITTMAQAPTLLPEQGLLASGAKYTGAKAGKGALIIGGSGDAVHILEDVRRDPLMQLGAGIGPKIELTLVYLHNLEALVEALQPEIDGADGDLQRGLRREQEALSAQLDEVATFLKRYLELIPAVWEQVARAASEQADLPHHPRYKELKLIVEDLELYRQRLRRFFEEG